MASFTTPGKSVGLRLTDLTPAQVHQYQLLQSAVKAVMEIPPVAGVELRPQIFEDRDLPIEWFELPRPVMVLKIQADDKWWAFICAAYWSPVETDEGSELPGNQLFIRVERPESDEETYEERHARHERTVLGTDDFKTEDTTMFVEFQIREDQVWVELFYFEENQ